MSYIKKKEGEGENMNEEKEILEEAKEFASKYKYSNATKVLKNKIKINDTEVLKND